MRKEVVSHLGALDFVEAKDNVIFLGPPGTGKTHLAIALGIRACQARAPSAANRRTSQLLRRLLEPFAISRTALGALGLRQPALGLGHHDPSVGPVPPTQAPTDGCEPGAARSRRPRPDRQLVRQALEKPGAETQRLLRSQSGGRERAEPRRLWCSAAWEAELCRQRDTVRVMCKENIDLVLDRSARLGQERSMSGRSFGTRTLG